MRFSAITPDSLAPQRFLARLFGLLFVLIGFGALAQPAASQGTVQTSILGVPPVLPSPNIEDFIRDYERGLYPIQVAYTHPSRQAAPFRFRVTFELDGERLFETTSEPVLIRPGIHTYRSFADDPDIRFRESVSDLIDRVQRRLRNTVIRTGGLPEGTYLVTVEAEPEDPFVSSLPGTAQFTVRFAEPPFVVAPLDGVVISQPYPIFSWLPVVTPLSTTIEYQLVVVELMRGQAPQEAILGNRPLLNTTTTSTTLVYGPENLPLERGRTYAWQLTARDAMGNLPISNDGRSEIQTFVFDPMGGTVGDIAGLTEIVLVPDFAKLTGLDLSAAELSNAYRLDGRAVLELALDEPVAIAVDVQELDIQKTGLDRPVLMGGGVKTRLRPGTINPGMEADFIELTGLSWAFGEGFTVDARLELSGDRMVQARGRLNLTPQGIVGRVEADLAEPLVFGVDPVEVHLSRVAATFPAAQLLAEGDVLLFGEPSVCGIDRIDLRSEEAGVAFSCDADAGFELVEGSDRLMLNARRISGEISLGMEAGDFDYDLSVIAGIDLASSAGYCGADANMRLTPGTMTAEGITPTCGLDAGRRIDLGALEMELQDLRVTSLSYDPAAGWDFAFDLSGDFLLPAIDPDFRWSLDDFQLTRSGFTLPRVELTGDEFPSSNTFDLGGFRLEVGDVQVEPVVFPWFNWTGADLGPWDIRLNGDVVLPAGAHLPACMSGRRFALNDFRINAGGVSGSLPFTAVDNCALEIGPSAAFLINSLDGSIAGDYSNGEFSLKPTLDLDAQLSVGHPFVCEGERATSLAQLSFAPGAGGTLSGTIENVAPECPVAIGPLRASITDASIDLDGQSGEQRAQLSADAQLALSPSHSVSGSFGLDLTTGTFTSLDFSLDDPFEWGLPAHDPLLTFRIQQAELGLDGFRIDGRQEVILPDGSTFGATFDNLRADIETSVIEEGEIIFDTGFALEAGIIGGTQLNFGARPSGSTLSARPGVLIDLPGTVRIGRSGLTASGAATAQIDFGEWSTDLDVEAVFSSDFALGLDPVGVARGRVDLEAGGVPFAYIDSDGFHPNPAAVAGLIPDVLPLPNEDIAYLELRRDGQLVVNSTTQPDGTLLIETLPGESLDLVVPYLDGTPRIAATLSDVRVRRSGSGFAFESGLIEATAPSPIDLGPSGIPFSVRRVLFGQAGTESGASSSLVLAGDLRLFGDVVGSDADVTLAVSAGGDLSGAVDLDGINHRVEFGAGGLVGLELESLAGSLVVPFGGTPVYDWTVAGGLSLHDGSTELARADVALRHRPGSVDVLQFQAGTDLEAPALDLGDLLLDFGGLTELKSLTYSEEDGFNFRLAVDFRLGLRARDAEAFWIDLKGIEISSGGLHLPSQSVHAGTIPRLDDRQALSLGPIELRLLAVDLAQDVVVEWPDFSAPDLAAAMPSPASLFDALKLSLGVTINGYPSLEDFELSIYEAGFTDGLFTGAVEALSFIPGHEPLISIGETAGMLVKSIAGTLFTDTSLPQPRQGFEFDFDGEFELPTFFERDPSMTCPGMDVALTFAYPGGLRGTVDDFAACGSLAFGPASLDFPSSTLSLDISPDGAQSVTLEGNAVATLGGAAGDVTASGDVAVDVLTGRLTSGALTLNGSFDIGLPADDPLLQMTANELTIDRRGLVIDGNGLLSVGSGTAGIDFDGFAIDPREWVVVDGSMRVESGFAFEVGLEGSPSWQVTSAGTPVDGSAALRLDVPADVTLDPAGLHIGGGSTASLHYGGETYASLSVDFVQFALGLSPVGVRTGRADMSTSDGTRVAYYDADGFHFDAAGIIAVVVPDRLPLPTEDVAYLKLKDDDGNLLINYEAIEGGYAISSLVSGGSPQPLELVVTALGEEGSHPTASLTIDNLHVNSTMQQVMSGSVEASINQALTESLGIPLHLQTIRYARDGDGAYALTTDGRIDLPAELGDAAINFTDLGFTSSGFTGEILVGEAMQGGTCSMIDDASSAQAITSIAYAGGGMQPNATPEQLSQADLGLALLGVRLTFDPDGGHSFAVLGQASSRLTASLQEDAPTQLPFLLGYEEATWRAEICTDILPSGDHGNDKLSLMLAELYLDEDNGGSAALEIGGGDVDLILSGMLALPEVMGGEFRLTVEDLRMGTGGITIGSAGGGLSGQETTLFGDVLKLRNDELGVAWDADADALVLTLAGSMWLTPFMCEDGNATACADQDAVSFSDLRIDTRGNVTLGGGAVNLLAARQEPLAVIGNNPQPTLGIDMLALRKPADSDALFLDVGGELNLPDVADGVSSSFLFSVNHRGEIASEDALHMRFVRESANAADQVDERGDNPATEIDFGGFALLDVKEAGLAFSGGSLLQPAVYANASIYIQDGVDNQIRLGTLGGNTASSAGLYVDLQAGFSVNAKAEIDEFDLGGFLALSDISVATNDHPDRGMQFVLGGVVDVNLQGLASTSADWRDLTIDRQGIAYYGRLGSGGLNLTIVEVVSLSIGAMDYGSGTFDYFNPETEETEQKTAETYFAMTGAEVSLTDAMSGGVDAIYYYRNGNDSAFEIYNANISLAGTVEAALTMRYVNEQGNVFLSAAGKADVEGIGALVVAGQMGRRIVDSNPVTSFGLFVSLESTTGVPILPGIITLTSVGGGFFNYPDAAILSEVENLVGGYDLVPSDRRPDLSGLRFAVLLHGGAGIVGQSVYMLEGSLLLRVTDQHSSVFAEAKYLSMDEIRAGFYLNVHYGANSGVEGGAALAIDFPSILEGQAGVNFAAYDRPEGLMWMIDGKLGDGGDGPISVMRGMAEARGDFLASNDGVLLRELSVSLSSPKIYIVEVKADAEMSFWYIPDRALGGYGELAVEVSVLGGLAKAGADLKGAYLREQELIYMAASAYVSVLFVFEGRIGIWASIEQGRLKADTGTNPRYDRMVADARQQAEDMIARADEMAAAMEAARTAPFEYDAEMLSQAGLQLVSASAHSRANYAEAMLCNEQRLYVNDCATPFNNRFNRLNNLARQILTGPRPNIGTDIDAEFRSIERSVQTLQDRAAAVEQYLRDLEVQAIEWSEAAAMQFEQMQLESPLTAYQPAVYTGEGDERRMIAAPSFHIDEQRDEAQTEALADLKRDVDALDEQYRSAIASTAHHLGQITELMSGSILYNQTSWASYSTSVNHVAETYADITADIQYAFAVRADSLWRNRTWAEQRRSAVQSGAYARHHIETIMDGMISDYKADGREVHAVALACNRFFWIQQLRRLGDSDFSLADQNAATNEFCAQVTGYQQQGRSDLVEREFRNAGIALWHDVPREGLDAWSEQLRIEGRANRALMNDVLQPIQSGHLALTQSVDRVYLLQSEMAATLHGMLEEYISWRRGSQGLADGATDTVIDAHEDMRLSLLRSLEAPTITDITASRNLAANRATASIWASATHPEEVAQLSYAFRQGSATNIYGQGDLYGSGRRRNFTLHTFANTENQTTQDWSVFVRARGPLGNSVTRATSFTLAVAQTGRSSAPDGMIPDMMPEDNSPPSRPILSFPDYTSARDQNSVQRRWTNNGGRLVFDALAADAQSDIAGYEYRIGTTPGGDDVRGWSEAVGVPVLDVNQAGSMGNALRRITVHGLALEEGVPYFVSVRATNGAGLTSSVATDSRGVVFDPTPPTTPGEGSFGADTGTELYAMGMMPMIAYRPPWPVVAEAPAYTGSIPPASSGETPSFTVSWTASSDPESGIKEYEYVVTKDADPEGAFEEVSMPPGVFYIGPVTRSAIGRTTSTSATVSGPPISFTGDVYVHVRAINNAGSPSGVRTMGPYRPVDTSAPINPHLAAMVLQGNIRVYLTQHGYDLESRVTGYQYAVVQQSPEGVIQNWIRDYPEDGATDVGPVCSPAPPSGPVAMMLQVDAFGNPIKPNPYGCFSAYTNDIAPYFNIPTADLPVHTEFYVYVRAVNGQGRPGAVVNAVGPIILDTTPPLRPGLTSSTVRITGRGTGLTLDLTNVHDPESGIRSIEYRLQNPGGGYGPWETFTTLGGIRRDPADYQTGIVLRGTAEVPPNVQVRLTNGSGLSSVESYCLIDCTPPIAVTPVFGPPMFTIPGMTGSPTIGGF